MIKIQTTGIFLIFLLLTSIQCCCSDTIASPYKDDYFYYPKSIKPWESVFYVGLSLTRLPSVVVEEEISQSPMLYIGYRLGLPWNLSSYWHFNSNYISNYGNSCLYWSYSLGRHTLAVGGKIAMWFGHLQMDAIHLKSYGWIINPTILYGIEFKDFVLSAEFETQHSRMFTFSEDEYLGTLKYPTAGYAVKFNIEQPLWKKNCVSLSVKFNYAKFYYQSWLTFNTLDEYLFYPEIHFGFIL